MASVQEVFTLGVEEEYQVIDPITRQLSPAALPIIENAEEAVGDQVQPELRLSQLEIATTICETLRDVRRELQRLRRTVIQAAEREGRQIASAGTHPFTHWKMQPVTPKPRYQGLEDDYRQLSSEQAIFGCHVHVGLQDRELALHVINRARNWLHILLALTASSPFWLGDDTGYESYRSEIWSRWPMSGPPLYFSSLQEYEELARELIATGAIEDTTKIYWDMRISERFRTVEVRVADACVTIDEAVMNAGLVRAIVRTCYEQALANEPFRVVRPELLRMAHWRAARYGLSGQLVNVEELKLEPAHELIESWLNRLRPALEAHDDWDEISTLVHSTLAHGNGAERLRSAYQRTGNAVDVVDLLVAETKRGTDL